MIQSLSAGAAGDRLRSCCSSVTFFICFPLIWALSTSLKAPKDVMATPPRLLPPQATLENYRNLITGKQQYYRADQSYVPTTAAPQHFTSLVRQQRSGEPRQHR